MATDLEWANTTENVRYSLKDPGANEDGKHKMQDALIAGDVNRMGQLQIGFYETQDDQGIRDAFDNCKRENQTRLYNIGRSIIGLPPV